MTIAEAISALGGASAAEEKTGIGRTTLIYWAAKGKAPRWRERDVRRLLRAAEKVQQKEAA